MRITKERNKRRKETEEVEETPTTQETTETTDTTEILNEIDDVLEGCISSKSLDEELREVSDKYDVGVYETYSEYCKVRDAVYVKHGTTRSEYLEKLGCGCGCPSYV